MKTIIVGEFKRTGINKVNIEALVSKWNRLCLMSKYNNEYRLIKYLRIDSPITKVKISICPKQANELISKLSLVEKRDTVFFQASSFRRQEDFDYLDNYIYKKYLNIKNK